MAKHVVVNSKKNGMIKREDISFLTDKFDEAKKFDTRKQAQEFIENHELAKLDHCVISLDWFQKFS